MGIGLFGAVEEQVGLSEKYPHIDTKTFEPFDTDAPGLRIAGTDATRQAVVDEYKRYQDLGYIILGEEDIYTEEIAKKLHPDEDIRQIDIGKSFAQMSAEFAVGKSVIDRLRIDDPENKDYQRAIAIDINTGDLIYPRFTSEELIDPLKSHPKYQAPEYLNWERSTWKRYIETNYDDLLIQPDDVDFYDVLDNTLGQFYDNWAVDLMVFGGQAWQTFVHGVDYIGAGSATIVGQGSNYPWKSYVDYGESGNWAATISTGAGDWVESVEEQRTQNDIIKNMYDPASQDYNLWVETTPFWSNMHDPLAWTRIVSDMAPSLMMSYGSGAVAFKGARLLGLSRQAARAKAIKTQGNTTLLLEGPSALQNAVAYHTQPTRISEEVFMGDQEKWKKEYLDEFYIIDELTTNASFPDQQNALDAETKPKKTRREFDIEYQTWFNDNYYLDQYNYWKKGLSPADALDKGIIAALLYAPVARKLEMMSASKFWDMLPGGWATTGLRQKGMNSFGSRIDWAMRKIPGSNKIMQIPSSNFGKIINMATVEGIEEFSQYTAEALISSALPLVAYKSEFDWDWNQAFDSFLGGAIMGGGLQTGAAVVNKTGLTDRMANRGRIKDPLPEGVEFYTKKQDDGTWGLFYSVDGAESQLKEGDGILESGIADSYSNFSQANKQAKVFRTRQRQADQRNMVKYRGEYIGATVGKPVFNEDTKKYEIEITGKDGNRLDVLEFDTALEAKNGVTNVQQNIRTVKKAAEDLDYNDEDVTNLVNEAGQESPVVGSDSEQSVNTKRNVVFLKNYLSEPVSDSEVPIEEDLIKKGIIPSVTGKMSNKDKKQYEDNVINAISDKQAVINSGLSANEIIQDIQDDFGIDAANRASEILEVSPPEIIDVTPPAKPDVTIPTSPEPTSPEPIVDDELDVKAPSKKTSKEKAKTVSEMSLKELNEELSKKKKNKDPMSKIRVKRIKKEIEARKKKVGKPTVSAVKKKQMEQKVAKFRDKSVKNLMNNILEGKKGPALIKDIAIDDKVIKDVIDWVDSQRGIMGDNWTDDAMLQLMSLSMAYEQIKAEEVKTDTKKDKESKPPIREQKVYKPQPEKTKTESRKEAVRRDIDDIVKQLQNIVVLDGGKKIKVEYIDDKDAPRGQWDGEKIIINLAKADRTTPIHEFMHPFIESLYINNKTKFNEIYEELKNTKTGQEVIDFISSEYGKDHFLFKVEVVVESIARTARMKAPKETNPFVRAIRKFLQFLKSLFFSNAQHIDTYNMPPSTTIGSLAEMLDNYNSPPVFNVLDSADTNAAIIALANSAGNIATNVEIVEEMGENSATLEDMMQKSFELHVKDLIEMSRDKNNKINGNSLKKNFKNIEQKLIDNLKSKYSFLNYGFEEMDSMIKDLKDSDKNRAVSFLAQSLFSIDNMLKAENITEYLPDFKDKHVNMLAVMHKEIMTSLPFRYKFADFLGQNADVKYNVKDIASEKFARKAKIKKNEVNAVKSFQAYLQQELPNLVAMKGEHMHQEYLRFVDKHYGLNMIEVNGYETNLKYDEVYNEPSPMASTTVYRNRKTHRVLITNDFVYKQGHRFNAFDKYNYKAFDVENNTTKFIRDIRNFNGLGWFAVDRKFDDIVLYEYQTDVIDFLIRQGRYNRLEPSYDDAMSKLETNKEVLMFEFVFKAMNRQFIDSNEGKIIQNNIKKYFRLMMADVLESKRSLDNVANLPDVFNQVGKLIDKDKNAKEIMQSVDTVISADYVKRLLATNVVIHNTANLSNVELQNLRAKVYDLNIPQGESSIAERMANGLKGETKLVNKILKLLDKELQENNNVIITTSEHNINTLETQIQGRIDMLKRFDDGSLSEDDAYEFIGPLSASDIDRAGGVGEFLVEDIDKMKLQISKLETLIETLKQNPREHLINTTTIYLNKLLNLYIYSHDNITAWDTGTKQLKDVWDDYNKKGKIAKQYDKDGKLIKETLIADSMADQVYGTPGLIPQVTNLWSNWFDILLKTSLGYADGIKSDKGSLYLNTANFLATVEGNTAAREIYLSKAEAKIDNFAKAIINAEGASELYNRLPEILEDLKGQLPLFAGYMERIADESNTLMYSQALKDLMNNVGHKDFHTVSEVLNAIKPYDDIIASFIKEQQKIDFDTTKDMTPMQKDMYKSKISNPRGGPWFQALEKLVKKKVIKVTFERPSYSNFELYKVDILDKSAIIPDRFQKELNKQNDMRFEPKNEAEVYEKVDKVVRYQLDEKPSRTARFESKQIFEGAWQDINNITKSKGLGKADPWDFRKSMINNLPAGQMSEYFLDWFDNKFKNDTEMKYRKKFNKENNGTMASPEDVDTAALSLFNDEGWREGLSSVVEQGGSDERELGINEFQWMAELGIFMKEESLTAIKQRARKNYQRGRDFESWAEQITPYIKRRYSSLNDFQKMQTKRFYIRINSYVTTNTPEGKYNERDGYVVTKTNYDDKGVYTEIPIVDVQLKDGINLKTGNQNPYGEKIMLFESIVEKDLFKWVGTKDYYNIKKFTDKVTQQVSESLGDIYGFLSPSEFDQLQGILDRNDLAIAFMRGEQRKLGLVRISKQHKKDYQNIDAYIEKEEASGYMPKDYTIVVPQEMSSPADIAIHEAMKKVWPRYLFDSKGAANIMKRIKIPFTPISQTKDIPDFKLKIFDPSKASFVFGDVVSPATVAVPGVGLKYINDGGSMASRTLWNNLGIAGVPTTSGSNKNVIYYTSGMNTLMVKHEMSKVETNMEIWYNKGQANEQLVAKVDNLGNITDANGTSIDLLATPDEVKVGTKGDGYAIDAVHMVPGSSIGFINYRDKAPTTSTHGTQWYGYVQDESILKAFEDNVMKSMNNQLAGLWNLSVDSPTKMASDKISDFLVSKLENTDNEGYRHSVTEHAKLGAGLHRGMEPMLNVLLQSKGMSKILKSGLQPGTRSKIVGNLRGDLKENEIALAKQNATVVYQAYAESKNISLTDARKVKLSEMNEWLKSNPVEVMITRFPVPHVGGIISARVKRLHSRKGLIEMTPVDVYAKLEGDMDGDEVQVEKLNAEHQKIIKDYLSNLNISGINLGKYVPSDRDKLNYLSQEDRIELMFALSHGANAIGEMANLLNVYGQLSRVFDNAVIDNNKIVMRSLDEKVMHPGLKTEMPLRQVLRLYMQASLDNAEFMLLDSWNYYLPSMYALLFKKADGTAFRMVERADGFGSMKSTWEGTLVYNALKPLINMHKIPGRLRRGGDFNSGKYALDDVVRIAENFLAYTENRVQGFKQEAQDEKYLGDNKGFIQDLVFKEDVVPSPWEMTTVAAARTMQEHIVKYDRRGFDNTVFRINPTIHENAHLDTVKYLDSRKEDLIERAYQEDLKNGLVNTSKKSYLNAQKTAGLVYRSTMGKSWFDSLIRLDKMGPQTLDRNDKVRSMAMQFDTRFKALSKTARVMATLGFLEGFNVMSNKLSAGKFNKSKALRVFNFLPHASKSKNELQLLDQHVLMMFYKEYNKLVSNPSNRMMRKDKARPQYRAFDEVITRMCR